MLSIFKGNILSKLQKIINFCKLLNYLFFSKTNSVRNILLKYPDYIFLNSSDFKNEILRGYFDNLPFNGQKIRKKMIDEIFLKLKPNMIVETGTYLGNTLDYFLTFNIPTYSIEMNEKFYYIAKSRFLENKNLNLVLGDSASFLKELKNYEDTILVYLDAHWYSKLPLNEELEAISKFTNAIVLIDDFKVPGKNNWKYDSYNNTNLTIDSVDIPTVYKSFFPNYTPLEDGGLGTGCMLLAKGNNAIDVLSKSPYLEEFT